MSRKINCVKEHEAKLVTFERVEFEVPRVWIRECMEKDWLDRGERRRLIRLGRDLEQCLDKLRHVRSVLDRLELRCVGK